MFIKICGITNFEDAEFALSAGASALGLIFCESKRKITAEIAHRLIQQLPPFANVVGLFMNQSATEIQKIVKLVPLNTLQFHGDENLAFCEHFNRPFIKAFKPDINSQINYNSEFFSSKLMRGYLLDAGGGSGKPLNWQDFVQKNPQYKTSQKPLILAGGLTPDNVRIAIDIINPQAVDVSSGVESITEPPRKDFAKINKFITNANLC